MESHAKMTSARLNSKPHSSSRVLERVLNEHKMEIGECNHKKPHNTYLHVAAIVKRGKVLATAENRVGSRSSGAGYSTHTIHAERAVVKKLGDISKLKGATLCVWRVSSLSVLPSKPCDECQIFLKKCMKEYGLSSVHYTDTSIPL